MKNPIAESIADFLKRYHPFTSINSPNLLEIAQSINVIYLEKNDYLFKVNDQTHKTFYMVASGAIGLTITSDSDDILIDKCDEGDIIGLRPFFAKDNYLMNAKAREESIVYAIPIEVFKPIVMQNSNVLNFLLQSFASNTRNPLDKNHKGKLLSENVIYNDSTNEIQYYQPIRYTKNAVTASSTEIVKNIALIMTNKKIGSIIIHNEGLPIGIVTDKDLRSKIATGRYSIETTIDKVMSSPVITVTENLSIVEAQIMMLKHNVGHLCVTKDGTSHSQISGIISEHDIVVAQANNPGVLLKQAKRAQNTGDLKNIREKVSDLIQHSIDKNIPIKHICSIVSEINTAITRKAIDQTIEKLGTPPPCSFSWINIGSQGRKEQLLLSDQDNAIIFEDVSDERYDEVKEYFLNLGGIVTKKLNKIGYSFCEDNMMASNPLWCKSISDWKNQFKTWILNPREKQDVISTLFFDYDFVYGNDKLVKEITDTIFEHSKDNQLFLAYLGSEALKNPPPLGFFRQFLVESDGEHKDTFDIKRRALLQLIDAARILILDHGVKNINNTASRFAKLAEIEPLNATIYEACEEAFLELVKFRTEEGLMHNTDGNYLNLKELSKLDKVKLKNTFQPINDVQELIKNKFKLTYFT
ncbi:MULTISPECIES: DUF294 nucleotidyltransferase-like domain-containing protein [Flavobacterium]|uniref:DUF294 nucleotidyltransferase-like domain-containing protein n=1 Tax=Flavobacterium jumunjinense TaxID=998845 RepID=A0ABV5GME1_9FLAO|nr:MULTISPECIES: DUF294 nucleotidyltransferase-like domain-containing protein [Flavobacterium]